MVRAPGLGRLILVLVLLVTLLFPKPVEGQEAWDPRLMPPPRYRQRRNPRRNLERWLRRQARRERQRPQPKRPRRRRVKRGGAFGPNAPSPIGAPSGPPVPLYPAKKAKEQRTTASPPQPPDPLAHLRARRGWIDYLPRPQLWKVLIDIRWPHGPRCPYCGEKDPRYLELIDPTYRDGLGRWRCRVCAEAGDAGEGGTFTPLTGTILDGMRLDIRTFWLVVEGFVKGKASVETAREARVNRHTTDRLFRLVRAAIYQSRSTEPIALGPEDIVEGDEVYITAGLKGHAGGQVLDRPPRQRGLKKRGRGTWESDRVPVFGLLRRGGEVRLFVVRNVRTETIRPIVEEMVRRGARVYTDNYSIYHFLGGEGYQHATVHHGAGEYARGEVHCNTLECTWSWLRQMVRTYRGISKVYLPLYVAQFEFFYNRRHKDTWNRTLDLLAVVLQADGKALQECVEGRHLAEVCPVAG